jgi:hypothetical protein
MHKYDAHQEKGRRGFEGNVEVQNERSANGKHGRLVCGSF